MVFIFRPPSSPGTATSGTGRYEVGAAVDAAGNAYLASALGDNGYAISLSPAGNERWRALANIQPWRRPEGGSVRWRSIGRGCTVHDGVPREASGSFLVIAWYPRDVGGRRTSCVLVAGALACFVGYSCSSSVTVESAPESATSPTGGSAHEGGAFGFNPSAAGGGDDVCADSCGSVFEQTGCIGCVLDEGACEAEHSDCRADAECTELAACVSGCRDDSCTERCRQSHADGLAAYDTLYYCLTCFSQRHRCSLPCHASCTVP